jgi:hypothetical protein
MVWKAEKRQLSLEGGDEMPSKNLGAGKHEHKFSSHNHQRRDRARKAQRQAVNGAIRRGDYDAVLRQQGAAEDWEDESEE